MQEDISMSDIKKLTILHSNDMHGDFLRREGREGNGRPDEAVRLSQ